MLHRHLPTLAPAAAASLTRLCSSRTCPRLAVRTPVTFAAAITTPMRYLRMRTGAPVAGAPPTDDADEPATAGRRAPPSGLTLGYVLEKMPADSLTANQTEAAVWAAGTVREAWRALYSAIDAAVATDPARAATLRAKDLPALARCTAHAETLHLLSLLPPAIRAAVTGDPVFCFDEVEEVFLHLGQDMEVRGAGWTMQLPPPTASDLQFVLRMVGRFGDDGRGCIPGTAHRVAVWRGRLGEPLGVTIRVGRFVPNAASALLPLTRLGSVLIISRAGMGKTTLLRDLAASIAQEPGKPRVTVVDTSNEVGGDGAVPLAFLGRCRRIQVPTRDQQGRVMTEVIQNHSPEYLVVDELASAEEAQAAWSIAQRGVRLIATCHGETLAGLLQNQSLNLLVGGVAHAFLSNEERRLRNKVKKTVLERPHPSPFRFVVELHARNQAYVYVDVNRAVDLVLDDQSAKSDAAVGGPVELNAPLPRRLAALVDAQERAARRLATVPVSSHEAGDAEGLDGAVEDNGGGPSRGALTFDEDGYSVSSTGYRRTRGGGGGGGGGRWDRGDSRGGKGRRGAKSDAELLKELDRML